MLHGQTRHLVVPWCIQLLEASSNYSSQEKLDSNRLGVPNYPRSEIPAFLLPGVNNASGLQRKYNIILLASTLPRVPCVPPPSFFGRYYGSCLAWGPAGDGKLQGTCTWPYQFLKGEKWRCWEFDFQDSSALLHPTFFFP